jgi:type IV pilus assembly protein PilV
VYAVKKPNKGFSLLEVLVTILLTTVGILGMVAMQGNAISHTQDSIQRTHAVMLANDLIEIIRARPSVLANTQPDDPDSPFFGQLGGDEAPVNCLGLETDNLTTDLVSCWAERVKTYLPGAEEVADSFYACISTTPGTCDNDGAVVEVQMAWKGVGAECLRPDLEAEADDSICTYRFRTQI